MVVHCTKCAHEWQAVGEPGVCSWCGAEGRKIAEDYLDHPVPIKDTVLYEWLKERAERSEKGGKDGN